MARSRWQATIADSSGNIVPEAEIEIRIASSGILASVTSDRAGLNPKSNPFDADIEGYAFGYVAPGRYNITASLGAFSQTWTDVLQMDEAFLEADRTKLDGIEAAADVTDAANVAAAISSVAEKTSLADSDLLNLLDSAAGFALKKISYVNYKAAVKTYFDTLYSDFEIITSGTVANSSSLDFTDLTTTYRAYLLVFDDLLPASDNVELFIRTDTNNGASFDAGASDYAWASMGVTTVPAVFSNGDAADSEVSMADGVGNVAGEEMAGQLWIHNPMNAGCRTTFNWKYSMESQGDVFMSREGGGQRLAAEGNNAIRMVFSTGNIATMNYTLYGLRAS